MTSEVQHVCEEYVTLNRILFKVTISNLFCFSFKSSTVGKVYIKLLVVEKKSIDVTHFTSLTSHGTSEWINEENLTFEFAGEVYGQI